MSNRNVPRHVFSWYNRDNAPIMFFDNEINNIIDVDSVWNMNTDITNIACNHIDDTLPNTLLLDPSSSGINYTHLHLFDHNTYTIYLRSVHYQEMTPPCQGFSYSHRNDLIKWIQHKQGKPFIVIFDWDQTISVTNGVIKPPIHTSEMYQECAEYLLGGPERLEMFHELERYILDKRGEIYILTANTLSYDVPFDSKRPIFLKLVQRVFFSIDNHHLLSSYQDGKYCSKSIRLLSNNYFFDSVKHIYLS
jgi:hypothetical protein